jgi:hypothetical protein
MTVRRFPKPRTIIWLPSLIVLLCLLLAIVLPRFLLDKNPRGTQDERVSITALICASIADRMTQERSDRIDPSQLSNGKAVMLSDGNEMKIVTGNTMGIDVFNSDESMPTSEALFRGRLSGNRTIRLFGRPLRYYRFRGGCVVVSNGPDLRADIAISTETVCEQASSVVRLCSYDPTNGALSSGDIAAIRETK